VAHTVLIVDDHVGFRGQVAHLLEGAGYHVVGSCGDGPSALAANAALCPEIVLLDVNLPDTDGFALLREFAGSGRSPVVILISTREAGDYGGQIERSGAAGFISKGDLSAASLAAVVGR